MGVVHVWGWGVRVAALTAPTAPTAPTALHPVATAPSSSPRAAPAWPELAWVALATVPIAPTGGGITVGLRRDHGGSVGIRRRWRGLGCGVYSRTVAPTSIANLRRCGSLDLLLAGPRLECGDMDGSQWWASLVGGRYAAFPPASLSLPRSLSPSAARVRACTWPHAKRAKLRAAWRHPVTRPPTYHSNRLSRTLA